MTTEQDPQVPLSSAESERLWQMVQDANETDLDEDPPQARDHTAGLDLAHRSAS